MNAMIPPPHQLDIFRDSDATVAQHFIRQALITSDYMQAARQIAALSAVEPGNEHIPVYQGLLNHVAQWVTLTPDESGSCLSHIRRLEEQVLPLARRVLQHGADDFLAPLWRHLAGLGVWSEEVLDPEAIGHPSYCFMRIRDWNAVRDSLLSDRRTFASLPLALRLIQCLIESKQQNDLILAWCHAIECFGDRLESLARKESGGISQLYEDFCDIDTSDGLEYLPAFLIFRHPGVMRIVAEFPPFSGAIMQAALEAVARRLKGDDELSIRRHLNAVNPVMVRLWMAR